MTLRGTMAPGATSHLLIVFGHFALPFTLLLSRNLKKTWVAMLAKVAIGVLLMRLVDMI